MTPAFIEHAPTIEDKGAVFVLTPADGQPWAMTRHQFQALLESGRRAVVESERRADTAIIPLCELCVRFNLSRIDNGNVPPPPSKLRRRKDGANA